MRLCARPVCQNQPIEGSLYCEADQPMKRAPAAELLAAERPVGDRAPERPSRPRLEAEDHWHGPAVAHVAHWRNIAAAQSARADRAEAELTRVRAEIERLRSTNARGE